MQMRVILSTTVLSFALAMGASACKKTPAEKVEAAKKNVDEQREDVREQERDLAEQKKELAAAKVDLVQARAEYEKVARERLTKIDDRIRELEARGDAKSKQVAADLRVRRDQASAKLDRIGDRTESDWEQFKSDVDRELTQLGNDIENAFK